MSKQAAAPLPCLLLRSTQPALACFSEYHRSKQQHPHLSSFSPHAATKVACFPPPFVADDSSSQNPPCFLAPPLPVPGRQEDRRREGACGGDEHQDGHADGPRSRNADAGNTDVRELAVHEVDDEHDDYDDDDYAEHEEAERPDEEADAEEVPWTSPARCSMKCPAEPRAPELLPNADEPSLLPRRPLVSTAASP
nr:unnamed protein product [Digitaria exilis]